MLDYQKTSLAISLMGNTMIISDLLFLFSNGNTVIDLEIESGFLYLKKAYYLGICLFISLLGISLINSAVVYLLICIMGNTYTDYLGSWLSIYLMENHKSCRDLFEWSSTWK